jgi:hypothetical protein
MASFASAHDTSTIVVQPKSTSRTFVELLHLPLRGAPRSGTLHLNISLERQELIADASAGALFSIRLEGHRAERTIHDFLLNEVPDAPPAWHRWSYAFNLRGYAQGDTLLLGVAHASGTFKVRSVRVEASYPR